MNSAIFMSSIIPKRFWRRVERYQSDYLIWKKWLKQNGQSLKF